MIRILFLLVVIVLSVHSNETTDICVLDTTIATLCEKQCNKQNLIYSLSDLPNNVDSGTTVWFCLSTGEIELNTTLHFHDIHDVSFQGLSEDSVIVDCRKSNGNTGLMFTKVEDLHIYNLMFTGCGSVYDSGFHIEGLSSVIEFSSTIYIVNSTNINVQHVNITESNGNGLSISNTNGTVTIVACVFASNAVRKLSPDPTFAGGSGLYIHFNDCSPAECRNKNSYYLIKNCSALNNTAIAVDPQKERLFGFGRGGGMQIFVQGQAENNSITILHCHLHNNSADVWGGGLHIKFSDLAQNNKVHVNMSLISFNTCAKCGGGGVNAGFREHSTKNTISFYRTVFNKNSALYGGGASLYSMTFASFPKNNSLSFIKCLWMNNIAEFGSAVDIAPVLNSTFIRYAVYPPYSFQDCSFLSNYIISKQNDSNILPYSRVSTGRGAFYITKGHATFQGTIIFKNNNGSALCLMSGSISCSPNANVSFVSNHASTGAAIMLTGNSETLVTDNTVFSFINNTAIHRGGAIYYQLTDPHEYVTSLMCFIQYIGTEPDIKKRNISFLFIDNKVCNETNHIEHCQSPQASGNSIYASSLYPCIRACSQSNFSWFKQEPFGCIGRFEFSESLEKEVSTFGSYFKVNRTKRTETHFLMVIPGKEISLEFEVINDLQIVIPTEFAVTIDKEFNDSSNKISIDNAYSLITNNKVVINGNPTDSAIVTLSTIRGFQELILKFKVMLQHCPPGFVLIDENINHPKCACSVNTDKAYVGVKKCNMEKFRAYIQRGYWIGYRNRSSVADESNLFSGDCPIGFCVSHYVNKQRILLPSIASKNEVEATVCSKNRIGALCGLCRNGSSVFYNSVVHHCHTENHTLCKFGWLFYILGELVPVTIVYLLVLTFNISFTSGSVSGFIFFAQVVSVLDISANNFIWLPFWVYMLQHIYLFLYQMLSLKFSFDNSLAFCLWEGASTLDVLAFHYVTIVYSLGLVFLMVLAMKCIPCRCLHNRHRTLRSSFIHGLSAFLVMTYTKCTRVSLKILTFSTIYSPGGKVNTTVVFYNGEMEWMKGDHLRYALPAVFFLVVIVIIPTIMLLVYPLCYKVFRLLNIEESSCVSITCKIIPLEKLKPLYDSLQYCFKDELRIFASLHFLYRFVILALFAFCTLYQFYTFVEIVLVIALVLHSIAQPYKKRWHNTLDSLMLGNLAIINGLTMYNYKRAKEVADRQEEVHRYTAIQVLLVYLPLLYMCAYLIVRIISTIKWKFFKGRDVDDSDSDDMPARLLEDSIARNGYQALNDEQ